MLACMSTRPAWLRKRPIVAPPSPPEAFETARHASLERASATALSRILLPGVPARIDQQGGTCVAHAARIVYGWWYRKLTGRVAPIGEDATLRFYDLCKRVDGDVDPDRTHGTTLWTALRVMRGSGFPLDDGTRGPHIAGYEYVGNDATAVRASLVDHRSPVLWRIDFDQRWLYLPASRILRAPGGTIIGGHAMAAVGFDDTIDAPGPIEGADIDANSWVPWSGYWGGICYFPGAYKTPARGFEAWRVIGLDI